MFWKRNMYPQSRFGRPWPHQVAAYGYTRLHTLLRWSGEFLRRNEAYIYDWPIGKAGARSVVSPGSSARVILFGRRFRKADEWGRCSFRRSAVESEGCSRSLGSSCRENFAKAISIRPFTRRSKRNRRCHMCFCRCSTRGSSSIAPTLSWITA